MHAEDDMLASAHIARSDTTRWRERVGSGPREPQGTLVMISVPALMINDRLRRWRPVPAIDGLEMKSRVDEILNRHPAVGFALGVVRNGSLEFLHTHGLADLASIRPVAEHRLSDRLHHQDLHRDRRNAAVGAGTRRARRTRQRLSSRLPAGPRETPVGGLPQCDTC